jgi:translation initiation factor eIF-2B subunit beta
MRPILVPSYTSFATPTAPASGSLFGIFSSPDVNSQSNTPPTSRSPIVGHKALSTSTKELNVAQALRDAKPEILEGMREILDELDSAAEQIAAHAVDHIHSNEIIMVQAYSTTIQKFLIAAAKKRKFTILHVEPKQTRVANAETAPKDHLKRLVALGCAVVMIPDSHVSVIMPRVNKVIMAPYIVLSNGGLITQGGSAPMAAAARMWKVPVVAISGVYKFSPVFPYHVETFMEEGGAASFGGTEHDWKGVDIRNPLWDYVRPENVNLYVTSM